MTTDLDLDLGDGRVRVLRGRAEDRLRDVESGTKDAVVTDPPYGLSREPDIAEVLRHWLAGDDYTHKGGGFMGKSWDSFVPGPSVWREVYRILKPGGHVLCFAGTRTVDLMTIALRMAGFEIRDQIDWLYGSGFPKSLNVAAHIEGKDGRLGWESPNHGKYGGDGGGIGSRPGNKHRTETFRVEVQSQEAKQWEGWGTALKPAHEPIIMARKPFDGSVASNVSRHGTGAINIDASRVGSGSLGLQRPARQGKGTTGGWANYTQEDGDYGTPDGMGRWPANVILTHAPGCVSQGLQKVQSNSKATAGGRRGGGGTYGKYKGYETPPEVGYADADGMETVEAWECVEGCPVAMLDGQSGELTTGAMRAEVQRGKFGGYGIYGTSNGSGEGTPVEANSGGASRFFAQLNYGPWDYDPAWYTAKASKAERNRGLGDLPTKVHPWVKHREDAHGGKISEAQERFATMPSQNHHPTVKPVSLMRYLVRLITPPGGTVVDPYMGSGTTGVAGVLEGFAVLGCELDEDENGEPAGYMEVIEGRVTHAIESPGDWEPRPTKARAKPKAAEPASGALKSAQDQPKRARDRTRERDKYAPPPGWIAANFLEEVE